MNKETNNNEVKSSKRFLAYLLDILLLFFIISLISQIRFINPNYKKYVKTYENYAQVLNDFYDNKIDENEMLKMNKENYYYLSKYSLSYNIVTVVVVLAYFCLFQRYNNGQTLGKKIMKIKVVSSDDKNLNIFNYLLRSIFIYYIYIGSIFPIIINSISIYFLNPSNYMVISSVVNYSFLFISIILIAPLLFRQDKRGLHDIIAKTKVVYE